MFVNVVWQSEFIVLNHTACIVHIYACMASTVADRFMLCVTEKLRIK